MKVSAVINKPSFSSDNTKKSALISAVLLIAGIISGAVLYLISKDSIVSELWEYFINFSTDFSNKNKPEIFSGLVLQNLAYYILMLVFAVCAFGTPVVFFLSFIKSTGLGMLTAYIFDSFALEGMEYCLLVLLPGKFILIFAMILLTQNCYLTSLDVNKSLRNLKDGGVDFRKFSLRSLLLLIILLLSAAVDFAAVTTFSSLFSFS